MPLSERLHVALLDEMASEPWDTTTGLFRGWLDVRLTAIEAAARAAAERSLVERVAELEGLLLEMVGDYHQTGSIRDHVDPGASGWDVNKDWRICEDMLCAAARVLLATGSAVSPSVTATGAVGHAHIHPDVIHICHGETCGPGGVASTPPATPPASDGAAER